MAEIKLPRWILTNAFMPAGMRQSPLPKRVEPPVAHQPLRTGAPSTVYFPPEIPGTFLGMDYRFWSADLQYLDKAICECRCCGIPSVPDPEQRKKHAELHGCYKRLVAAYKLLSKDKICVICNTKTTREKWGIPICSSGCQEAWCQVETQPQALTLALALVGDVK